MASGTPAATAAMIDPQSDSEDDEQDAWLASIVVESKESLIELKETNQGADTSEEPQGDQDDFISATSAMVVDESRPLAEQRTIRSNMPPVSEVYSTAEYIDRKRLYNKNQVDTAVAQVESLRKS